MMPKAILLAKFENHWPLYIDYFEDQTVNVMHVFYKKMKKHWFQSCEALKEQEVVFQITKNSCVLNFAKLHDSIVSSITQFGHLVPPYTPFSIATLRDQLTPLKHRYF